MKSHYVHPLVGKWAEIGRPPLLELLRQHKTDHHTLFYKLFVADSDLPDSSSSPNIQTETLDAAITLLTTSHHFPTATDAFRLIHVAITQQGMEKEAFEMGVADALLAYLVRWSQGSHAMRITTIMEILELLTRHVLDEPQSIQLADCFAGWLATLPTSEVISLFPYFSARLKDPLFADSFLDRHGFHTLLRIVHPDNRGNFPDHIVLDTLQVLRDLVVESSSRQYFEHEEGMGILMELLKRQPSQKVVTLTLDILVTLTTSQTSTTQFLTHNGLRLLARILKQYDLNHLSPVLQTIKNVAAASRKRETAHMRRGSTAPAETREQIVDTLGSIKQKLSLAVSEGSTKGDGISVTGMAVKARLGEADVEQSKSLLQGAALLDTEKAMEAIDEAIEVLLPAGTAKPAPTRPTSPPPPPIENPKPAPTIEYRKPAPFIDIEPSPNLDESAIRKLIKLLGSSEFHLRAEAAGILRRITATKEFSRPICKELTEALMKLLIDEDHIVVQAAATLANMAAIDKHRSVMRESGLCPRLHDALMSYNAAALEQILKVIQAFVMDATTVGEFATTPNFRALRVLVHSTSAYGAFARLVYERLVDYGGDEVRSECDIMIHHDPWENILYAWRAEDLDAETPFRKHHHAKDGKKRKKRKSGHSKT